MQCKICQKKSEKIFTAAILNKYNVAYYQCASCGFMQTEKPYWLDEAYARPINITDTGILFRNLFLRDVVAPILYFYFDHTKTFVDYAGGYGIFTRLMRDIGYNFLWTDPYTKNLFAQGFEFHQGKKIEAVTLFEVFEHFEHPMEEIEKLLEISRNIIFSTQLRPQPTPAQDEWWYYGFEHGQHIAFYTRKTFEYIAQHCGLNFYTNGESIHLLTEKSIPSWQLSLIFKYYHRGITRYARRKTGSKRVSDMNIIIAQKTT